MKKTIIFVGLDVDDCPFLKIVLIDFIEHFDP